MATWKKVIVSGSQSHLQGITASNIPIGSGQTHILAYDSASGQIKYIATSSIVVSAAGGTIGVAEDGTYTDGVFTDFTPSTPIGTAVDRFNELFTALVPATPPAFAELAHDSTWSPLDGRTFALNTSSGYTPVAGTGSLTAINNGVSTTIGASGWSPGTQVRYGLVNNLTQLNFELQRTIAANAGNFTNYSDNAAEIPVGGGDAYFIDLNGTTTTPVSSSVSNPTASFSFLGGTIPAAATSSFITTGQSFPQKLWRDFTNLNLQIPTNYRRGWNYMKVFQSSSLGVRMTNYIDWIYEPAMQHGTTFTTAESITNLTGTGRRDISGIQYYTGFTCTVSASVTDFYSCSYNPNIIEMIPAPINFLSDTTAVTSGPNGVATNLDRSRFTPVAPTSVTQKLEMGTAVTASIANVRRVANNENTLSVTYTATGPWMNQNYVFKTSGAKTATSSTILLDGTLPGSLGETIENFVTESYRVPSASYNTQADLNNAVFSAATSLLTSPYTSELAVWNGGLNYPSVVPDYSSYSVKITTPPNYTSATGTRYFYRRFRHNSVAGGTTQLKQFTFSFAGGSFVAGDASGVPTTANQMTAHIKIPAATGYRNMMILAPDAINFPAQQSTDNIGCFRATSAVGTPTITSGVPFEVNMVSVPSSFSATNQSYVIRIGMFQNSTSARITNITANL